MEKSSTSRAARWRTAVWMAALVAAAAAALNAAATQIWHRNRERTAQSGEAIAAVSDLRAHLVDAETGQRGYLLTGDSAYLEPYLAARTKVSADLRQLGAISAKADAGRESLDRLTTLSGQKMHELDTTVMLRRQERGAEALIIVRSDSGKALMDSVRTISRLFLDTENDILASRRADEDRAGRAVMIVLLAGALLTLGVLAYLMRTLSEYDAAQVAAQREMALQVADLEVLARERYHAAGEPRLAGRPDPR